MRPVIKKKRIDPRLGTVFKKYLTSNNVWDDKFFLKDDPTVGRPTLSPAVMLKASEMKLKQCPINTNNLIKKGYALGGLGRFKDAIRMRRKNSENSQKTNLVLINSKNFGCLVMEREPLN